MERAACRGADPNLFFPEKGDSASGTKAQMICFSCPVRNDCTEYKTRTGSDYGIWAAKYSKRGE